jgi:hypothetical protein
MTRFLSLRDAWRGLSAQEWREISAHVTNCDFLGEAATWQTRSIDAGVAKASRLFVSTPHFSDLFRFDV